MSEAEHAARADAYIQGALNDPTPEQTLPVGYKLIEDPILPGWPWVLELPSGQLAHFTTEDRAAEYAAWHSNRKDET